MDDADDPGFRAALDEGIDLFNEQKFYEAYEVWAARWSEEGGDGSDLLQGLVQIAVGFAKLEGGDAKGTLKLLESGALKIGPYAPKAFDLDIDGLLKVIATWRQIAYEIVHEERHPADLPKPSLKK